MINIIKLIFLYICYRYLFRSFKIIYHHSFEKYYLNNETYTHQNCNHSYQYSKVEKQPSKEENGTKLNACKYCKNIYYESIPILNGKFYKVENLTSSCQHGNGIGYYSKLYGQYELTDDNIELHSIYGDKCDKCHKLIGEFNFKTLGSLKCTGYPRLIRLTDYWNNAWLLGGNYGNDVGCRISHDQGITWSEIILISKFPNHICSNIDLFELPNHDIISSFRAIGKLDIFDKDIKFNRKLGSSISHDGGITWENLGTIIDNFELAKKLGYSRRDAYKAVYREKRIGFFEPFVMPINNKITLFYADDFTPMINHSISDNPYYNYMVQNIYSQTYDIINQKWSEQRTLIMDGSIKKSPTGSGLIKRISRDGMPVATTMKDGTYVLIFEGTYRDNDYPKLTGKFLWHYKWFEILMSYSKDGVNWSNPVEIYISKNNGSKSSAPFILCTDNNQLIISFQTDEVSYDFGYKGDIYSIMKVMISKPGIPIEKINRNSFYALCNNNNSPIGGSSVWNGMMLFDNILYTVSSENTIKYSEIPIYDEPNKYNEKLKEKYYIKKGKISTCGDKLISNTEQLFIINKYINTKITNNFYTYIKPICDSNFGLIFGIKSYIQSDRYFLFEINEKGNLSLLKYENGTYQNLILTYNKTIDNYCKNNTYKMRVNFNPLKGNILTSINDQIIYSTTDKSLKGVRVGFISYGKNIVFKQILSE